MVGITQLKALLGVAEARGETVQTKLFLTVECHQALQQAADETGLSMSRITEAALLHFLEAPATRPDPETEPELPLAQPDLRTRVVEPDDYDPLND